MHNEYPAWFHQPAINTRKYNPSPRIIELSLKHVILNQDRHNKTQIIVGKKEVEDEFGIKRRRLIIIERCIRFDEDEKEFYIFYDSLKYWVKPVREPLNMEDMNLYRWTVR